MQTNTLNTQKKKSLRGVAHHLDPVVELIKVKVFGIDRASRDEIASELAEKTSATVLQKIGKVAVLYRHNPKANPKLSNVARYLEHSGS